MDFFQTVNAIVVVLGLPTILGASIYIGRKLQTLDHLEAGTKKIEKDLENIQNNLKDLSCGHVENKTSISALQVFTGYGVANSPVQPNEKGRQVLKDSGFNQVFEALKSEIFTKLDERKLRTLYDIEKESFNVLREFSNDPRIDLLKDYAVNHPEEPLDLIFLVGSWIVRDAYTQYQKK